MGKHSRCSHMEVALLFKVLSQKTVDHMVNLCKQFYDTCFNLLDGRVLLILNVVPRARGTGQGFH